MRRLPMLFCILLACAPAVAAIPRWDALPALDVVHLAGPHAGTTVCPMCRHGYDAGLLVAVPAAFAPDAADSLSARLAAVARAIDDARFRVFIVIEGEPSPALVDRLRRDAPSWHVARSARLPDELFNDADRAIGYVFVQRRVLARFDPRDAQAEFGAHARAAMRFLAATYAEAATGTDPDTPKGRLWLAPMTLASHAVVGSVGSADTPASRTACLVTQDGRPMPDTLLALHGRTAQRMRPSWLRTDAAGCLVLEGAVAAGELRAEVFDSDGSSILVRLDGEPLDAAARPRLRTSADETVSGRERVVGLPCEDCAQVLAAAPAVAVAHASLAAPGEPGERLVVSGVVRDGAGRAQPGIVLYVYQTDAAGLYHPDPDARGLPSAIARLHGWMRSDSEGRYRFETIRPGLYPDRSAPSHIHLHVIEPGRCTYYAGDYLFDDDPSLTPAARAESRTAHAGSGVLTPVRAADGTWRAQRDLVLGLDVGGYTACAVTAADAQRTRTSAPSR